MNKKNNSAKRQLKRVFSQFTKTAIQRERIRQLDAEKEVRNEDKITIVNTDDQ